jgi:SAM-dependent methyltransferase
MEALGFQRLFGELDQAGYRWEPLAPDQLMAARRREAARAPEDAVAASALTRFFGLGLPHAAADLEEAGLSPESAGAAHRLRPGISRWESCFVPHAHWGDPGASGGYVGAETARLSRLLAARAERIAGRRVLDLGSGAGALALGLAGVAREVRGIECAPGAVAWARAAAQAQGLDNLSFAHATLGQADAERAAADGPWDAAVFNPPMAVSAGPARPTRDGGPLGIELPLLFLDFARRHLRPGGEALCLMTNPWIRGRPALFDRLDPRAWAIGERRLLDERFNQSLQRKDGYAERGIERIELWFLRMRRR